MAEPPPVGELLELSCVLAAPPRRVFQMLTEVVEIARWWGPRGFCTPAVEIDLRFGGRYRISMQPPEGELFHLAGKFLDVDGPIRLAFTFSWEEPTPSDRETVVTITLVPVPDGTKLLLSHAGFATQERRSLHHDGWTDSFERLAMALQSP